VVAAYVEANSVGTTYQECAKGKDPQPEGPQALRNKVLFRQIRAYSRELQKK
jgi:hypothetical protein